MMVDGVTPLGEALRPLCLSGPSTLAWRREAAGEPAAAHRLDEGLCAHGGAHAG